MANYLKVLKRLQIVALLELGWSYRRIEAETGVRRETVSRYAQQAAANPAKVFPGSEAVQAGQMPPEGGFAADEAAKAAKVTAGSGSNAAKVFAGSGASRRAVAGAFHSAIVEKVELGLSAQRIFQDLVEEFGYGHSYESVKRYVRKLDKPRRAVGVFHSGPGEEGQIDFFPGAPTLDQRSGEWKRPWVFRMTLCHSRHGYEEAVWDQKLETFLRLHENAFRDLGGVVKVIRHDNLKAAVVRACLYDPDSNQVYAAFARHWGFTPLPTRPRTPQENGKQERSGGYVQDNALKGRRFDSLDEHNAHLRRWNRTIARLRIHGTTRRQVYTHFLEVERPALGPLAAESFPFFECGKRTVHPDGHVEVQGAYYPAPIHLVGRELQVRWDRHLVRLYEGQAQVAVYQRLTPGQYARRPGAGSGESSSAQQAFVLRLLGRCERVGTELRQWAEEAFKERGVRAIRLIQGVVALTRFLPKERVLYAARTALLHRLFRYRDLRRLAESATGDEHQLRLLSDHPSIRPMSDYRLEDPA